MGFGDGGRNLRRAVEHDDENGSCGSGETMVREGFESAVHKT